MKRHKRFILMSLLTAGIFFLLGFLVSSQTPRIRSWILVKIEQVSRENLPVRILPGHIEVNFFPLGTTLSKVRILPKDEVKQVFDPLSIETLSVTVSPLQLMQGKLRLTDIKIKGTRISARVPEFEESNKPPLDGFFDLLAKLPVTRLTLEDVSTHLQLANPNLDVYISNVDAIAEKRRGGLILDVKTLTVKVRDNDERDRLVRIDIETSLVADRDSAVLSAFKLRRGNSYIVASGQLKGNTEALQFSRYNFSLRSELKLKSLSRWAKKSFAKLNEMPDLQGQAFFEAQVRKLNTEAPEAEFTVRTNELTIDAYNIDRLNASGSYIENTLKMPQLTIENAAGSVSATEAELKLNPLSAVSAKISTPHLQLHELLKALGIGEIPVYVQLSGDLPCSGNFQPSFSLSCRGHLRGQNLLVRPGVKSQDIIVALRDLTTQGELTVDHEKVTYSTDIQLPNSKGHSRGVITYRDGFKIDYEASQLDFKDITSLAQLKLEGSAKLKGTTSGDSHAAKLAMDLDGTDLWLEDFWLGNARSNISYKSGILTFGQLQGHYSISRYNGEVRVDVNKSELFVNARSPFFDARDLLKAFSRKVELPFPITGTGQAQASVSGPLQFNQLTYDLKTSLFRGSVAGESFDQAHFDLRAVKGEVETERVQINKGASVITLSGKGHPDGNIDTVLRGRGLRLDDISMLSASGLNLSGVVDFDMDMKGPVLSPDTDLNGRLTKTSIGDQGVPDSKFHLKFGANAIEGDGAFLGEVLKTAFVIPLDTNAPFALKMQTTDWNFAPFFAAVSGPTSRKDFVGRLTSRIDLSAPSGGFWNSTGSVEIPHFAITRGPLSLKNAPDKPLSLSLKNGQVQVNHFDLNGDNAFLTVSESKNPASKVDLQVNGKFDLSLIALLTPFFEDLRGILSFAFNLRAGPNMSELLGSAYIEKGYLKFFDFPHAFEDLRADILFNQRRVLFNTIKSEFGGGRLSASGGMELKGYRNVPVNVTGTFDKVTLNVPEKVKTTGSGTASFSGNWFPFLLKIDYQVAGGMISKDFGGESSSSDGIRRHFFLPEFLLKDNFVPVHLDLGVNFSHGIDIKNELMEGRLLGNLDIKGDPAKPAILGSITMDKDTKVIFKDTQFEVTSSNIQFTDPNEINPKLYIAARSRVKEHDINLLVQGVAAKPDFTMTSVPPLSDKDIISLLAIGATDNELNQSISATEQTTNSGLQVATGLIKKNPISDVIKNKFGVDLQFSAGFDDGKASVQKVIASRQFTKNFDVSMSRSFGKQRENEAKLRYRLNDRLSLVGSWQGREYSETVETTELEKNPNKIGLDVEYKFEFK